MTTLTHRDLGPDKRAAEMSDNDDADTRAGPTRGQGGQSAHAPRRAGQIRRPQAARLGARLAALLTMLIGLSDIIGHLQARAGRTGCTSSTTSCPAR